MKRPNRNQKAFLIIVTIGLILMGATGTLGYVSDRYPTICLGCTIQHHGNLDPGTEITSDFASADWHSYTINAEPGDVITVNISTYGTSVIVRLVEQREGKIKDVLTYFDISGENVQIPMKIPRAEANMLLVQIDTPGGNFSELNYTISYSK